MDAGREGMCRLCVVHLYDKIAWHQRHTATDTAGYCSHLYGAVVECTHLDDRQLRRRSRVLKLVPRERVQQRIDEQIVELPVPQILEKIVEVGVPHSSGCDAFGQG